MGRTTVQVDEETADRLHDRKARGESYDDVIRRLLGDDVQAEATTDARTNELTQPSRRSSDSRDILVPDTVPEHLDHADARAAIAAALDQLADGPRQRKEIAAAIGDEHDLGYSDPSNRKGSWWRKVVKAGLEANGAEYKNGFGWTLE